MGHPKNPDSCTQTSIPNFDFPLDTRLYKNCLITDLGQGKHRTLEGEKILLKTMGMKSLGPRSPFEDVLSVQRQGKMLSNNKIAKDCMAMHLNP